LLPIQSDSAMNTKINVFKQIYCAWPTFAVVYVKLAKNMLKLREIMGPVKIALGDMNLRRFSVF